ncbi:aldehyde dehydrogenase family protein, partial [Legionella pneumophila]|uniref:aldehyde dehydrogenase family protein n=1 Tax=Legionella pneumophila TaxID=446 RepID=UPI0005A85450
VNSVAFTGSVAGGERDEQTLAGRFIPVNLELGGKDPATIRADADLDHAVDTVIDVAFFNSGQSCCGIERIYVHNEIYEQFVNQAVNLVKQYQLGRLDDPETTLGPLVRAYSADFVREQIQEAIAHGDLAHINTQDFVLDRPGTPYLAPHIFTAVH